MNFFKKIGRVAVSFGRGCKWFFSILWKKFKPEIFLTLTFILFVFVIITINTVQYNRVNVGIYQMHIGSKSFNIEMDIGDMLYRKVDHETGSISLKKRKDTIKISGSIIKYKNNEIKDFGMFFDINNNKFLNKKLNELRYTSYIQTYIATLHNKVLYRYDESQDTYLFKSKKYAALFNGKDHYESILNNEKSNYPIQFHYRWKGKSLLKNNQYNATITDCYTDNYEMHNTFNHRYEGNLFFSSGIANYLKYKAVTKVSFVTSPSNIDRHKKEEYEDCSIAIISDVSSNLITNIYPEPDKRTARTIVYNTPEKIEQIFNEGGLTVYMENFTKGNFVTGINNILNVLSGVIVAIVANNVIRKRHFFKKKKKEHSTES